MAKYCIHCGRKLEDGEVCTCQVQKTVKHDNIWTDLLDVFKGMFVKPVDTVKKYTDEKYFNLSLVLIGIMSLMGSLFGLSFFRNMIGGISYYMIRIPYLQIFFVVLLGCILGSIIYVGFLYLVNAVIFKGDKSFKKYITMYGINSIIVTAALFLSAILMFIVPVLGLVLLAFGYILNVFYMFKGIECLGVKDENKHGYIYLITMIFCLILCTLVSLILNIGDDGYNYNGFMNTNQQGSYNDIYSYYGYNHRQFKIV